MPKRGTADRDDALLEETQEITSKRQRKTVELLAIDTSVKKKEIKPGKGVALKNIPAIAKELKKYPTKGNRMKNVLEFNGFPDGTKREAKRKQLMDSKYTALKCSLIKFFLSTFLLDTNGTKDALIDRLLDFMFNPLP